MTPNLVYVATVGVLFAAGATMLLERSLTRVLMGVILFSNGVNLLILSGGRFGEPPIVGVAPEDRMSDPLPQAMILTAIVITLGVTAFLLAMAYRSWQLQGHDEVQDDAEDRRIATGGERRRARQYIRAQKRALRRTIRAQRSALEAQIDAQDELEEAQRAVIREQIAQARRDLEERLEDADDEARARLLDSQAADARAAIEEARRRVREARQELAEHLRTDRENERRLRRELRQRIRAQKQQLRASIRAERERLARAEDSDMQGVD